MPRLPLLLPLLLALPFASNVEAQTSAINRCVASDGSAVFTDRACDSMDARPVVPPPEARTRNDDTAPAVRECPRRPEALILAVEAAFARADGNRLAALYDWRGRSRAAANAVMPRLETLAGSRLLSVQSAHSADASDDAELAAEAAQAPPDRLRITHAPSGLGPGEVIEFRLLHAAGCWWITD